MVLGDSNCYVVKSAHVSLECKQIFGLSKVREENTKVVVWKVKGA